MFLDYYQLREQPFGIVSEPVEIYPSQTYCEALESLGESLLGDRGSLTLTAEPGMGKTTLLSQVLDGLRESQRSAFLFQKECSSREILQFMLGEMRIDSSGMDASAMQSKLNGLWFAEMLSGRRFVLLFDDAEQLSDSSLETVQSLARYETTSTKLVQVVLCGQPRLEQTLQRGSLTSLRKRMAHTMHLQALTPMETAGYVRHRLKVAGYSGESLFTAEALALVAENSGGVPRDINKICSRALLEAYARGLRAISADIIEKAGRNLQPTIAAEKAASAPPPATAAVTTAKEKEAESERTASMFPQKPPGPVALPGSGLWAGAIVGLLLSAGLALPHGMLHTMTHLISGIKASAASLPPPPVLQQPESSSFAPKQASAVDPLPTFLPTPINNRGSQISLTRELGLKINRIVIDAGHGGWDIGAKGPHGLMEKDVCLDVALRLGQLIEQNIPGAQVVYTRKDDTFIPLEERTAIGNRADADLFISIHANSSSSRNVRGVETYYLSLATSPESKEIAIRENSLTQSSLHDLPDLIKKITNNEKIAESRQLATDIQSTLARRLQLVSSHEKNRGVKQAPFIVLTGANMPAVLSEISFVTNDNDEILLLENGQRQRIAEGLCRGIMAYLDGLAGVQLNKQKLLTENRTGATATFQHPATNDGRSPL
jgi:N-acetylmuramoyl-L-alanine amidase